MDQTSNGIELLKGPNLLLTEPLMDQTSQGPNLYWTKNFNGPNL